VISRQNLAADTHSASTIDMKTIDPNRYERQLAMPEIGEAGQHTLEAASVAICGLGGLGSAASLYLAAAGVGRLVLIDHGAVELSNLNRQVLYGDDDLGARKAARAKERLARLAPSAQLDAHDAVIDLASASTLLADVDVVVDAMDNFEGRHAVNAACVAHQTPLVHGACAGFEGRVASLLFEQGPCLSCLYADPPTQDGPTPILGATAGLVGAAQAGEAIRVLLGVPALAQRLLLVDTARWDVRTLIVKRRMDCPVCGVGSADGE